MVLRFAKLFDHERRFDGFSETQYVLSKKTAGGNLLVPRLSGRLNVAGTRDGVSKTMHCRDKMPQSGNQAKQQPILVARLTLVPTIARSTPFTVASVSRMLLHLMHRMCERQSLRRVKAIAVTTLEFRG
jgi:hypothetical protein